MRVFSRPPYASSWLLFGAIVAVAAFVAVTAAPLSSPHAAKDEELHEAFEVMAFEEREMRRNAAKDFPADLWSQDDAFHNSEYRRAKSLAAAKSIRVSDVLLAVDEGLHHRWPTPENVTLRPMVPPCRPRPIH